MDVRVWVLLDGLQVVLVLVLVVVLDNVAVRIVARRIVLEDVALVARVVDALEGSAS